MLSSQSKSETLVPDSTDQTISHSDKINLYTAGIKELNERLSSGTLTSAQLLSVYLEQIDKHNDRLRALIHVAPREQLAQIAAERDEERKAGKCRGVLHGIPIIVK
jgi:amidase